MKILNEIENNFKNMVKSAKVDLSVINDLNKFRSMLIESKNQFSKKKNILKDFPIFHALGTQIRVIEQMIHRVNLASKINDNPEVADDALLVLPPLRLVSDSLSRKLGYDSHYIMGISSRLQLLAMKNNMYPPRDKVIQSIGRSDLKNSFNRFVNKVVEEIERI